MNNLMEYKGYVGSVEFSENDGVFYGKVQGIKSLISYEGKDAKELLYDFHEAVDSYLKVCDSNGVEPEKAYKGSFNVRISPELHQKAALYAIRRNSSLNKVVEESLQKMLG